MFDDFAKYESCKRYDGTDWRTPLLAGALGSHWIVASNTSSYSEIHIDATGYCTAVQVIMGCKLWNLLPNAVSELPDCGEAWEIKNDGWVSAMLYPGSCL